MMTDDTLTQTRRELCMWLQSESTQQPDLLSMFCRDTHRVVRVMKNPPQSPRTLVPSRFQNCITAHSAVTL